MSTTTSSSLPNGAGVRVRLASGATVELRPLGERLLHVVTPDGAYVAEPDGAVAFYADGECLGTTGPVTAAWAVHDAARDGADVHVRWESEARMIVSVRYVGTDGGVRFVVAPLRPLALPELLE